MLFSPQFGWPVGVLGGGELPAELARTWLESAAIRIAADGGANHFLRLGIRPDWVVGDFDSATPEALGMAHYQRHIPAQDSTDCDKLLALAEELKLQQMVLLGAEGDRLDHTIGTLMSVARSGLDVRILLRTGWAKPLIPGEYEVHTTVGTTVSLLPLGESVLESRGLRWEIGETPMSPGGLVSVSNEVRESPVHLIIRQGLVALFVLESAPHH